MYIISVVTKSKWDIKWIKLISLTLTVPSAQPHCLNTQSQNLLQTGLTYYDNQMIQLLIPQTQQHMSQHCHRVQQNFCFCGVLYIFSDLNKNQTDFPLIQLCLAMMPQAMSCLNQLRCFQYMLHWSDSDPPMTTFGQKIQGHAHQLMTHVFQVQK